LSAVEQSIAENKNKIAAIIVEPVVGNMGCVPPLPGFLEGLRTICNKEGIVLIFDEVMTGFRLSLGGAQELYGVKPDLTNMGKIIGGGMPVGAYGGKKEIMQQVAPAGKVYQAGTLSGNPIAMAAGIAMLTYLKNTPSVCQTIDKTSSSICEGLLNYINENSLPCSINRVGSMFTLFFTKENVIDFNTAKTSDLLKFGQFFRSMLEKGVYLAPSQYESLFVSTAITQAQATQVIEAAKKSLAEVFQK